MAKESNVPVLCLSTSNIEKLNEIDLDRLFLMWAAFSKNKGNLEHGSRLENLSWRFWYHKQSLPDGSNNLSTLNSFKKLIHSFDEQNNISPEAQKSDIAQTNHIESSDNHDEETDLKGKSSSQQQQQKNNSQGSHYKQDQSSSPPLQNSHFDAIITSNSPESTEKVNDGKQNNHSMSGIINNDPSLQCNKNGEQKSKQKTQTERDQIEEKDPLMFSKCKPTRSNSTSLLSDSLKNEGIPIYFKPSIVLKPLDEDLLSSLKNSVPTIENQNSTLDEGDESDFETLHDNYRVW